MLFLQVLNLPLELLDHFLELPEPGEVFLLVCHLFLVHVFVIISFRFLGAKSLRPRTGDFALPFLHLISQPGVQRHVPSMTQFSHMCLQAKGRNNLVLFDRLVAALVTLLAALILEHLLRRKLTMLIQNYNFRLLNLLCCFHQVSLPPSDRLLVERVHLFVGVLRLEVIVGVEGVNDDDFAR